jgi:hypothetical protein
MNVKDQADRAAQWIELIGGHDDEDLTVRVAMLDHLGEVIEDVKSRAEARNESRIIQLFNPPKAVEPKPAKR